MELSLSIPPPYDYVPSRMEIITAQLVASVTNGAQIPPMHLPTWFPVLGVIGSILSCVLFTILLPQWWKPFEVYLDSNQKKLNHQSSSSTPSIEKLLSSNDSNIKVLIQKHDLAEEEEEDEDKNSNWRFASYMYWTQLLLRQQQQSQKPRRRTD